MISDRTRKLLASGQCQECPADKDTSGPACQFFQRVNNASIAIWNEYLQEFQNDRAAKHDKANKRDMARVRWIEEEPENCVCGEAFDKSENAL